MTKFSTELSVIPKRNIFKKVSFLEMVQRQTSNLHGACGSVRGHRLFHMYVCIYYKKVHTGHYTCHMSLLGHKSHIPGQILITSDPWTSTNHPSLQVWI